jgi:hypothetical protein
VEDTLLPDVTVLESAANGANGWIATVETTSAEEIDFTVQAICLPLNPAP